MKTNINTKQINIGFSITISFRLEAARRRYLFEPFFKSVKQSVLVHLEIEVSK